MKLICGPMATISHPAFRILVEQFGGCDEYYTEMINAGTLITNGPFEKYYIDPTPCPEKLVWQIIGKNEELTTLAVKQIAELPGIGIDINMGCSAPDIYRFGSGIAWMTKPLEETALMIRNARKQIDEYNKNGEFPKRFSAKIRLGDENFTDESFYTFCNMLVNEGVECITLHPRTKKEKLARPPRHFYCEDLAQKMKKHNVQVYLNGNVKDIPSAQKAIQTAPTCDGVMISRAAVQKPWIFAQIKSEIFKENVPDSSILQNRKIDMLQMAFDYIDNVEKYQPQEFWKTRLQRFFTYYADNFLFAHMLKTKMLNATDNQDMKAKLVDFFEKFPEEKYRDYLK